MRAAAFLAGAAIGILAFSLPCASFAWRTCTNESENGFTCSFCKSFTEYEPKAPFRYCPMCGSAVIRKEEV